MKLTNLSDGSSDGVVIFYMKKGMLHSVFLNKDQASFLDIVITAPFTEEKMIISQTPVKYENMKHMMVN